MTRPLRKQVGFWLMAAGALSLIWAMRWPVQRHWERQSAPRRTLWRLGTADTMWRARPLIAAIRDYTRRTGNPPAYLEDLVPEYLKALPAPGPMAAGGWSYLPLYTKEGAQWELEVTVREDYSPQVWPHRDRFVYLSDGRYPQQGYGGALQRIGDWGFYWE